VSQVTNPWNAIFKACGRVYLEPHEDVPVLAFFGLACLVAVLLFAGWGLAWGGFPQFSEVRLL